jgi:Zn ribbon nucleic-acid-binding protein
MFVDKQRNKNQRITKPFTFGFGGRFAGGGGGKLAEHMIFTFDGTGTQGQSFTVGSTDGHAYREDDGAIQFSLSTIFLSANIQKLEIWPASSATETMTGTIVNISSSNMDALLTADCSNTSASNIGFGGDDVLASVDASNCPNLDTLQMFQCPLLETIDCSNCGTADRIELSDLTSLTSLRAVNTSFSYKSTYTSHHTTYYYGSILDTLPALSVAAIDQFWTDLGAGVGLFDVRNLPNAWVSNYGIATDKGYTIYGV